MNELSLIPATKEFCKNSNIVELKDSEIIYSGKRIGYIKCLYYPEISSIIESCWDLFDRINIKELDFSKYDFRNVTSFGCMFLASKVEKIIGLNCSDKCNDLTHLCWECHNLREFDASKLNTKNVVNFKLMFFGCIVLQRLNLSNLDFSSVTDISCMFKECEHLTELYLSSINRCPLKREDVFKNTPNLNIDNLPESWKQIYGKRRKRMNNE